MQIVIDIPEEVKRTFDNAPNEDLYGNYYDRNSLIGKAIQNGIPLDKIRAEIEQYNRKPSHYPIDMISIETVLQIIDRYRNEVSK